MPKLDGKKVAILATDGFEQSELIEPKKRLEQEGATTQVIAPKTGQIRGWKAKDWGDSVDVDVALDNARIGDYDALVLPGGVINPDKLRTIDRAVSFVREFFQTGPPLAIGRASCRERV